MYDYNVSSTNFVVCTFILGESNSSSGDQNPRKAIQWLTHGQKVALVRTAFFLQKYKVDASSKRLFGFVSDCSLLFL